MADEPKTQFRSREKAMEHPDILEERLLDALDQIAALKAENARLREALEPFAFIGQDFAESDSEPEKVQLVASFPDDEYGSVDLDMTSYLEPETFLRAFRALENS